MLGSTLSREKRKYFAESDVSYIAVSGTWSPLGEAVHPERYCLFRRWPTLARAAGLIYFLAGLSYSGRHGVKRNCESGTLQAACGLAYDSLPTAPAPRGPMVIVKIFVPP